MAKTVAIRQAVPGDGGALLRTIEAIDRETEFLGVPGHPHPWDGRPEAELRALADQDNGAVFVAEAGDGAIVGYLGAFTGRYYRNRGGIFIAVVGVREAWRGQGIGTRLFAGVEQWARARRAWRLDLRVSSLNERGLALYRKSGFAVEGRICAGVLRHGAWTDDFWMGKLLDPLPAPPLGATEPGPRPPRRPGSPALPLASVRPVRPGDGAAFRAWDLRSTEALPYALKLPAEVPSAEAIERDIAEAADQPRPDARPDARSADPRLWLVATLPRDGGGERIVGFGSGSIEHGFRMQHDAFVTVAVLPECAGQGLGRALHDRVEAWARGHGVRRLSGAVQAPNYAGRRFAAALGFDEEVVMRGCAVIGGRMIDRIRLGRLLAP